MLDLFELEFSTDIKFGSLRDTAMIEILISRENENDELDVYESVRIPKALGCATSTKIRNLCNKVHLEECQRSEKYCASNCNVKYTFTEVELFGPSGWKLQSPLSAGMTTEDLSFTTLSGYIQGKCTSEIMVTVIFQSKTQYYMQEESVQRASIIPCFEILQLWSGTPNVIV